MAATTVKMKGPVRSADQATRIVTDFLMNTGAFGMLGAWARPIAARRKGDAWLVRMDVGILVERVLEFEVDAATGEVRQYGPK